MLKADRIKYRHPPAPPGFDNENSTVVYFYKPETNPIVRMVAAERAAEAKKAAAAEKDAQSSVPDIIDLLDQFLLETPPVSEDEEEAHVKEQIIHPAKIKLEEPVPVKSIELDDSIIKIDVNEYLAGEKRKKILVTEQKKEKKKERRKSKYYEEKRQHKHSGTKHKTDYVQNKSHKTSTKESLSSGQSNSSPINLDEVSQLPHSDRSPNSSSKRPKSPTVIGHKRRKSRNSSYVPNRRRSASRSCSPDMEDERRSARRSPTRRSNHTSLHRRSPSHKSHDSSPSRRISSRTSPHHRSRRSPSNSPDGRSYRHKSPPRSKYANRPQKEFSKRYGSVSPDRIRAHKSPVRDTIPHKKSEIVRSKPSRWSLRSPEKDCLINRHLKKGQQKESSDKSQGAAASKPENRRLVGKFKKFPIPDEYSKLLAEEMKKRHLIEDSDEENSVVGKLGSLVVPLNKGSVSDEETTPLSEDQKQLMKYELGILNANEMHPGTSFPQTKFFRQEEIKKEIPDKQGSLLNSYYCQACQLGLNSELTWQSHINGKKHAKMLKLQTMFEIAKGSIAIPSTPAIVSEDVPRFAEAAAGKKRHPVGDIPRLLPAIMDVTDRPLPGLHFIQEIVSEMDVNYYCELCDAPCGPSSIMPHLIGYKHQLRFLRHIDPLCYERNRNQPKKKFEHELSSRLFAFERIYGRGRIKVIKEQDDPDTRPFYDLPGPSWRQTSIPDIKEERKDIEDGEYPNNDEFLDTSKGDFFCKLCDSHMNNVNMWEAHVRGKRHLKNAKKIPGENVSKVKSVKVPGARSKLERLIEETARDELIVGLNFLRETQGINGEIYNCFLCGSCSTNFDIIEHLLLPKHRHRYLEKLVTEGKPNEITGINQMDFNDPWFRNTLIDNECRNMIQKHGIGKVEVYKTKN